MVINEPNISDNCRLSTVAAARMLGIDRSTLYRASKQGFIRWSIVMSGKRCYTGKDIKKFWRENI